MAHLADAMMELWAQNVVIQLEDPTGGDRIMNKSLLDQATQLQKTKKKLKLIQTYLNYMNIWLTKNRHGKKILQEK